MTRLDEHMEEDEINIREIVQTVYRYKYMILLITIVFTVISAYIAYFTPSVYQATATVEVGLGQHGPAKDVITMATDPGRLNPDTEIEIIQSDFLAQKALENVDFTHRYYKTVRFRELELYEGAPFRVGMLKGYDVSFILKPVDKEHYRLIVEHAVDRNGTAWEYDKVHKYGEEVKNDRFHLNVIQIRPFTESQYRFVIQRINRQVGAVSVSQRSKYSTVLHISYTDNVGSRAQAFTNAIAEAYITQNVEKKTREATLKLEFIDAQLKKITENLKGSAIKIEEFKKSANTVSLSVKAENIITQMSDAEAKLEQLRIEAELLDTLHKKIKKSKRLETISMIGLGEGYSVLEDQIDQLQKAIIEKKILREDYTEVYPAVIKLNRKIIQLKKLIISTIGNLLSSTKEHIRLLEKSIGKYQVQLNKVPADERMYGQLLRKFEVNEKIYSYLLEKRSETAIIKASTVSKNRIIDRAVLPVHPIKPKRKRMVLIGLLLGLLVGIGLAFLRKYLDNTIQNEEDVTKVLDIPVLGHIPHMKEENTPINVFAASRSAVAESFRNLRTNLQFMVRKNRAHVIAVTSTVGEEGKTTVCINLAAIMSMAKKKTIILNLDMRKPTLHEKFGLPNVQGMSTLLSGSSTLRDVIQKTEYENLHVITSGPTPPNPSELIQSRLMEKIIEKLREVYDVVIIDTPPIGLVTDARSLMHLSDTSIYVVRAGHSKKEFLQNIKKLSLLKEIHGMGIVVNDVKKDMHGYHYSYGYGYGYYEEEKK